MSLLNLILFAEFSVALCAVGIWVYRWSNELEKWVNETHIDYHFSQDFDDDWAALTLGKIIASLSFGVGLLGLCISLGILIFGVML